MAKTPRKRPKTARPKAGTPVAPKRPAPASAEPGRLRRLTGTFGFPIFAVLAAIGLGIFLGVRSANQPPPQVPSETSDSANTTATIVTRAVPPPAADAKTLFTDNCGTCHTLAAAGSTAGIGPNLDESRPNRERVASMIANGSASGIMQPGLLTGDDADRVAAYVARVAGTG